MDSDVSSFVVLGSTASKMYPSLPDDTLPNAPLASPPSLVQLASHISASLPYSVYSSYAKKIQLKPDRGAKSLEYQPRASIGNVLTVEQDESMEMQNENISNNVDSTADISLLETILKGLSTENEVLRKTIESNSQAMRKQLRLAQNWKQEADLRKQSLCELQEQSESMIKQLQEENELLKRQLEGSTATAAVTPSAPPESSFFWDDLSLQLQDRMDHLELLDQMHKEKQKHLTETMSELEKAKETISQLESRLHETPDSSQLIQQLKQQVQSMSTVNLSEQNKESIFQDELAKLSLQFNQLMSKTIELEKKVDASVQQSASSDDGKKGHKKESRRDRRHKQRRAKPSEEEKDTAKQGHTGHHGRLLRKLAKHSHVANLATGIALKSVKELKDGLKQAAQEAKK